MINGTAVRLLIVALLVPLTYAGANWVQARLDPPGVEMPDWTFRDMPKTLGNWHGEDAQLDQKTAVRTGAKLDTIVDRVYRDDVGHAVSMHTAMFDDPKDGVIHSPMVCYMAAGWKKLSEKRRYLKISGEGVSHELSVPVSVSKWENEKDDKKVMVVYWYQLGEHFLFGRWDLGLKVRWALAGKPEWPALVKVMMEVPFTEDEDPTSSVLGFAERVAKWENLDKHRYGKGMLGVQAGDAGGGSTKSP
jgi:EpsI family protein